MGIIIVKWNLLYLSVGKAREKLDDRGTIHNLKPHWVLRLPEFELARLASFPMRAGGREAQGGPVDDALPSPPPLQIVFSRRS